MRVFKVAAVAVILIIFNYQLSSEVGRWTSIGVTAIIGLLLFIFDGVYALFNALVQIDYRLGHRGKTLENAIEEKGKLTKAFY